MTLCTILIEIALPQPDPRGLEAQTAQFAAAAMTKGILSPTIKVVLPVSMGSVRIGLDGVIPAKIRISNFRIPADGDVCVLFYGKQKCAEGRPLPPGADPAASVVAYPLASIDPSLDEQRRNPVVPWQVSFLMKSWL